MYTYYYTECIYAAVHSTQISCTSSYVGTAVPFVASLFERHRCAKVTAALAARLHAAGNAGEALQAARRGLRVPEGFRIFAQQKLRALRLVFVVAPYEADAQIAKLVADGIAAAALTEDGDLVAYGCQRVLL